MSTELNPYAAPRTTPNDPAMKLGNVSEAECIRQKYFSHEVVVKSVAMLYFWFNVFQGLLAFVALMPAALATNNRTAQSFALVLALQTVVFAVIACGLQKLQSWARWIVAGISGICIVLLSIAMFFGDIGMLAFSINVAGNAFFLYIFSCEKARKIFSAEYRQVVRQTPHAKYRVAIVLSKTLIIVVALFLIATVIAILSGR